MTISLAVLEALMPLQNYKPGSDGDVGRWQRLTEHSTWSGVTETKVLAGLLLAAACVLGFVLLANEVVSKDTQNIDTVVVQWFRDPVDPAQTIGPAWLKGAALDVNALGGTAVLGFVCVVTLGFLWLAKKRKAFLLVAAAAVGGLFFNLFFKSLFARPRPDVVPHLTDVHTDSFPSGHSMMSAIIYLTFGAMLSRLVVGRSLRAYILLVAIILTLLVGIVRVFLGVHYPTDVLAGWTAGLAWALICLVTERILQHQGKVERPGEETEHLSIRR